MASWTFVRHGQSRANAEGWLAGVYDSELTPRGRQQARDAAHALHDVPFRRVFTSDLSRARDTATLMLADRPQPRLSTACLRERHCGIFECQRIEDVEATGQFETLTHWASRPPGGESTKDVALRALEFLCREDDGVDTLVVAHGVVIRCIVGLLDGRAYDQIGLWRPRNCEAVRRELPTGTWAAVHERVLTSRR